MRIYPALIVVALSTLSAFAASGAESSLVRTDPTTVELVSEKEAAAPGGTQWIGLLFKPAPGWHVYWKNPGDSGLPPRVEFSSAPSGSRFGPLEFTVPTRIPVGPLVNFAYEGEVLYPAKWTAPEGMSPGESIVVSAAVKWLVCREECVPGRAMLSLRLPVESAERLASVSGTHASLFRSTLSALPAKNEMHARLALVPEGASDRVEIVYSGPGAESKAREAYFFPEGEYGIAATASQKAEVVADGLKLVIPRKEKKPVGELRGVLKLGEHEGIEISEVIDPSLVEKASPAVATGSVASSKGIGWMLLFAFLGGLILNLMPCILPVLSIKVLDLAGQADHRYRAIRAHGFVYTLGILVSFWVLAAILLIVRAGGTTLGWGFQLQNPIFIAVLAILFFLMGLNLFGFFEVGARWMGMGGKLASKEGYAGSFFTGVLTTVAATPCSAPFMGTALGFALTQSAAVALLVLTFLGLGLSAPYLIFSLAPAAGRMLPRPGAWMKTLKEALAFPLFGTVVWLLGVLGMQAGPEAVVRVAAALVLVTALVWSLGWKRSSAGARAAAAIFVILCALAAAQLVAGLSKLRASESGAPASSLIRAPWKAWSEPALEEALAAKKTVLVNLTAEWCVTCKVNETVVFDRQAVRERLAREDTTALLGDWTNGDPKITSYMMRYGRNSVPVYLLYLRGAREPRILPQILSVDGLLSELDGRAK